MLEHSDFLQLEQVCKGLRGRTQRVLQHAQRELRKFLLLWEYAEKWRFSADNCLRVVPISQIDAQELAGVVQEGVRLCPELREEFRVGREGGTA